MVHLHFICCHNDFKKCLTFILTAQQKLLANFKSWSFHPCHEHITHCAKIFWYQRISIKWPTCSCEMPILMAISFWMIWTFSLIFPFNRFINPVPTKLSDYCHRLSNSLSIKIWTSQLRHLYIAWLNDAQCSHQHNNYLQQLATFGWSNAFCTQELNHGKLLITITSVHCTVPIHKKKFNTGT